MTKEMAINYLKSSGMSDKQIETVISALTCDDCISRQAVLNLFNKSDEYRWETTWIRHKIEELPSVTPKASEPSMAESEG